MDEEDVDEDDVDDDDVDVEPDAEVELDDVEPVDAD